MDLPNDILVHNETLGIKGGKGTLVAISPHGYYEVNLRFGERTHRVLLPIGTTVIISREPEAEFPLADKVEIER